MGQIFSSRESQSLDFISHQFCTWIVVLRAKSGWILVLGMNRRGVPSSPVRSRRESGKALEARNRRSGCLKAGGQRPSLPLGSRPSSPVIRRTLYFTKAWPRGS